MYNLLTDQTKSLLDKKRIFDRSSVNERYNKTFNLTVSYIIHRNTLKNIKTIHDRTNCSVSLATNLPFLLNNNKRNWVACCLCEAAVNKEVYEVYWGMIWKHLQILR